MKDPELEAFATAIERHLSMRRGREHVLSGNDFALVRSWNQAGFSLATVLTGIDHAFESTRDVSSLTYCRKWVEELAIRAT